MEYITSVVLEKTSYRKEGSDLLSYKIELQNRVMQNDVTL